MSAWALYTALIGVGAGALLAGRPLLAIGVGVVGGVLTGALVDAIVARIDQRRPGPATDRPSDVLVLTAPDR